MKVVEQPHRSENFKISTDPQLVEKIRDVVELYVALPANAVVSSVDEKSQIQALPRAQPILPTSSVSPSDGPTTTCAMGPWICSPRSTSRPAG